MSGCLDAREDDGDVVDPALLVGRRDQPLDGAARWEGVLPRDGSLRVTWTPAVTVEATREQIAEFPFVEGDALAAVVLPTNPTERDRYLAEHIPSARYVELPGDDHLPFTGDMDAVLDVVEPFLTGT